MQIPFVDLKAQYQSLKRQVDPAILDVLANAQFILGPAVESFEMSFAAYCGAQYTIGLNSGTAALELLLRAYGIGPGDECILPANTFFATAEAVMLLGATPVLVDCEEESALIDIGAIERAITPKTKAIIPVHLFGQPADMDEILALGKSQNILVIEDACQAHGATYKGKPIGSLAAGAAFSFYPGKNLGAYGDAGSVTTDDEQIARTVRMLREHGMPKRYHHELLGYNERMDGVQGAVLGVKLPYLDQWNEARRAHAASYRQRLTGVGDIRFITEKPDRTGVYHLFVIRTAQRDALQAHLSERGIATAIHYPIPLHLQKPLQHLGYKESDFPSSETLGELATFWLKDPAKLAEEMLSLPMYAELTDGQIRTVCTAVQEFFQ